MNSTNNMASVVNILMPTLDATKWNLGTNEQILVGKNTKMILEAKHVSRYLFHTNMSQPYPCNKNEMDYF
jgi:hypothetical protein